MDTKKYLPFSRKVAVKETRTRILIVCEGKQTEPNYFLSFPVNRDVLEIDIQGKGANTLSLVKKTIEEKNKKQQNGLIYNQVWCVFDRDSFPAKHFNEAFRLAGENKIRIAYSNQAFEIWYLLHFNFYDTAISRKNYIQKLSKLLKHKYEKNSKNIYNELLDKQKTAIGNAKTLLAKYVISNPLRNDPSTNVFNLVEALNEFIEPIK